jgi:hypothetical protein
LDEAEAGGRVPVPLIKTRSVEAGTKLKEKTKISTQHLEQVDWNTLIKADNADERAKEGETSDRSEQCVVMMRGMFGRPLLDILNGAGKVADPCQSEDGSKQKRRKRRPTRQPNEIRHVMPLSRELAESHAQTCSTLLQSLSLPAVIACQLQVVGTGTLKPGASICSWDEEAQPAVLGYVTAGSFSVARGCISGTGIIGASKFLGVLLEALSSTRQTRASLAVVGTDKIQLVVMIRSGESSGKATLALLL